MLYILVFDTFVTNVMAIASLCDNVYDACNEHKALHTQDPTAFHLATKVCLRQLSTYPTTTLILPLPNTVSYH